MTWDFEGIKERIKSRLALLSDWADILLYGTNERLIDAMAYILDKFAVYGEYLLRESKWQLAQNRPSLLYQAPYLKYIPYRKQGANGYVEISTDEDYENPWIYGFCPCIKGKYGI